MALIPADAGVRMRLQNEASLLQPLAPVHEISSDLPELRRGQVFSAKIQEVLPDNSYKALVAGKQLTLQLPEGAKAGDLLELEVVDRSAKVIIARQVDTGKAAGDASAPYPFAKFSPAARLIGQLLPAEGQSAPPAQLNRGQPLLAQAPQSQAAAVELAPTLAKAVTQSGLFYESHQAQWVTGKLPLEQLLQEPQGQRSAPTAFQHAAAAIEARAATPAGAAERPVTAGNILQNLLTGNEKVGAGGTAPVASQSAQAMPDDLRPLVQQQLETVATQRMVWQGEIWPQQPMDWEIEQENAREGGADEEAARWRTALSLTTPRLGRVDASLQLTTSGVRITLATPYGASAADMRDEAPKLAAALAAAGVPLLGLQVKHENVPPTPETP